MKSFLVLGSGVAGCAAAFDLAALGHRVTILESTGRPGGKVTSYCCKATDSCSRCGVCVSHAGISDCLRQAGVTLLTGAAIEEIRAEGGRQIVRGRASNPRVEYGECIACDACIRACPTGSLGRYRRGGLAFVSIEYSRCLLHEGGSCAACAEACPTGALRAADGPAVPFVVEADGVLIAVGHETFDPAGIPRLGYGRIPGVMTGLDAERMLAKQSFLPTPAGRPASRIAFIQCVGSRDPRLGRNFCSAVCCPYALRMARILKVRQPDAEVTVYCIDIQNFDKVFTPLREELSRSGVRFLRGVPFSAESASSGDISLLIEDPLGNRTAGVGAHDLVVLSVGMKAPEGSKKLAALFGLERDEFGFLRSRLPNVRVAGTCAEPQGIVDSIASARAAARELLS